MSPYIERKLLQQSYLYIPNIINSIKALNCIFVVDDAASKDQLLGLGVPEDSLSDKDNITGKTRFVLGDAEVFQEVQSNRDNVHYTKFIPEGSLLCWICSKRASDVSILRRICLVNFRLQDILIDLGKSINVISGDRGSGKTRFLRYIQHMITERESSSTLVKYFDALDIRRLVGRNMDDAELDGTAFLNFLNIPEEHENIVLLVDDVDDMHQRETENFLKVLEDVHIHHPSVRLWITCHDDHTRDFLEKTCGTFVMYLSPFTEDQRRSYLERELANRDNLETDVASFIHGSLAIASSWRWPSNFHTMDSNDCPNEESFISLPLHLSFISILEDVPDSLLCVYNNYITHKLDEFGDSDKDVLESCLPQLAMLSLFQNADEKFPMFRNILAMLERRIESDWNGRLVTLDKRLVQFEHMNVRDFLAAKWMANNYSAHRSAFAECLSCGLCSSVFAMFFNRHLADDFVLHTMVIDQNLDGIAEYLRPEGNLILQKDRGGRTPLHLCGISGCPDIAKALLECGADPNMQDDVLQWTPLEYADLNIDNVATVEVLLQQGADEDDLTFTNNATPVDIARRLDKAIQNQCGRLIKHICNDCNRLRITSKHIYEAVDCLEDDIDLQTVLRAAEVRPAMFDSEYADGSGYTALFLAVEKGRTKIVQYLVEHLGCDMNARAASGESLLHVACAKGHESIVSHLLEKEADINAVTKKNITPFAESCRHGHLNITKILREAGADMSINPTNETILQIAAIAGHLEIVKFLLEELGPQRDILKCIGFMEDTEVIRTLIKSGADLNCTDSEGCTPLHLASGSELEVFKLLVNHGADCNALNDREEPPLFGASQAEGAVEKIQELLDHGADLFYTKSNGENVMHSAGTQTIPFLVSMGIAIDSRTNTEETALHLACADGDPELVAALLQHGADPEARTGCGSTPLHFAACGASGDWRNIELLVNAGADVNARNTEDGRTPLYYALENEDRIDAVEILIRLGADVCHKDASGRTPLHHACRLGYLECVKFLIKIKEVADAVDEVDELGNTALLYALSESTEGENFCQRKEEIAIYLVEEARARVDIVNNDGKTAFDVLKDNEIMKKHLKEKLLAIFENL